MFLMKKRVIACFEIHDLRQAKTRNNENSEDEK